MEIERLEIGRLVVEAEEGAIGDAAGFARTVEAELRRMASDAGWTPASGTAIAAVDAGSFEWGPAEGETRLARQVAERIVHAIPRAARR
jgi:predicted cobalt transporter CbtA